MNENKYESAYPREPWDEDCYQTGSTRPPKNYRGIIGLLLGIIIFLGGISSALSMLNIRLFKEVARQEEAAVSFDASGSPEPASLPAETAAAPTTPDTVLKIQKMLDLLEENDDVQNVFHNADLPDEEEDE